tara:strand:- start:227 stop:685 length:459 start_codon:yes stop_codon:yes gene_type:complete
MFTKANVISAKFINEEHTTIEVLHTSKDDKNVRPYVLEYDKDSADFKALAKAGWDLEAVTDATAEYKREASSMWNNAINEAAVEMNLTNTNNVSTNIIETIMANNEDEDTLFKAKLTIMELDIVKKSKKTKSKQEIRKAKSLIEVISILNKL